MHNLGYPAPNTPMGWVCLSSYCLQMRSLRRRRKRRQLWDQGLHASWAACIRASVSGTSLAHVSKTQTRFLATGQTCRECSANIRKLWPPHQPRKTQATPRGQLWDPGMPPLPQAGEALGMGAKARSPWWLSWEGKERGMEGGKGAGRWPLLCFRQAACC